MSKLRWQNSNGDIELVEVNQQWLNKHDEQIRADEREKIIEMIKEIANDNSYCIGDICDMGKMHCEHCALEYVANRLIEE